MDLILASYIVLAVGAFTAGFLLGFFAKEWAKHRRENTTTSLEYLDYWLGNFTDSITNIASDFFWELSEVCQDISLSLIGIDTKGKITKGKPKEKKKK